MNQQYNKSILPNGIRVLTEHMPNVRSVSVGVWVTIGARDEDADNLGISHFIEHMIFKGTERRTALDIAKAFDQMGGFSNAFTSKEITCFHAKVLDVHLDRVLDLLSDILLHSRFDDKEVERERRVIMQEISMLEDSPDELIHELFNKFYWPGSNLGQSILGTVDNVSAISSQTLKEFVGKAYVGPKVLISAAGNLEHEFFAAKINDFFGDLASVNGHSSHSRPVPHLGVKFIKKDLEQLHVLMGYEGPCTSDPQRYPALLFNVILGGSMSSRLFQEIREKWGLAYSVYSFSSSFQDTGMLGIYAGISEKQFSKTVELMNKELKKLADQSIEYDELEAAKDHIKGGLLLSAESADSRMTRLAKNEINLGKFVSYDEVIRKINAVAPEDIKQMATQCLKGGSALVCLGPTPPEGDAWKV
ncbi:MAG: insulinase family protein [Deltaproteobacteria bacterium]|nr:insulinase family protein [Deltaproteobacteria bacterium]